MELFTVSNDLEVNNFLKLTIAGNKFFTLFQELPYCTKFIMNILGYRLINFYPFLHYEKHENNRKIVTDIFNDLKKSVSKPDIKMLGYVETAYKEFIIDYIDLNGDVDDIIELVNILYLQLLGLKIDCSVFYKSKHKCKWNDCNVKACKNQNLIIQGIFTEFFKYDTIFSNLIDAIKLIESSKRKNISIVLSIKSLVKRTQITNNHIQHLKLLHNNYVSLGFNVFLFMGNRYSLPIQENFSDSLLPSSLTSIKDVEEYIAKTTSN